MAVRHTCARWARRATPAGASGFFPSRREESRARHSGPRRLAQKSHVSQLARVLRMRERAPCSAPPSDRSCLQWAPDGTSRWRVGRFATRAPGMRRPAAMSARASSPPTTAGTWCSGNQPPSARSCAVEVPCRSSSTPCPFLDSEAVLVPLTAASTPGSPWRSQHDYPYRRSDPRRRRTQVLTTASAHHHTKSVQPSGVVCRVTYNDSRPR